MMSFLNTVFHLPQLKFSGIIASSGLNTLVKISCLKTDHLFHYCILILTLFHTKTCFK